MLYSGAQINGYLSEISSKKHYAVSKWNVARSSVEEKIWTNYASINIVSYSLKPLQEKMAEAYYEYQNQIQYKRNQIINVKLVSWCVLGFNGARKDLRWSNQH